LGPVDRLPETEWIRSRIERLLGLRRSVIDAQSVRAIDELIEEAEERLKVLGTVKPPTS
jgi:hypothetical protein